MSAAHELPFEAIAAVTHALNCGALMINRAGTIVHANDRFGEICSMPKSEIVGRPLESLYEIEADVSFIRDRIARFDTAFEDEFHVARPDGTRVPVIISSRPLGNADVVASFYKVITVIDITPQKRMEDRLTEDYRQIAKLSDTVLEQAIELKHHSERLEQKVRERTRELHEANMDAIYMLAVASEAKDQDTGSHVLRIRRYTELLALELGLPAATADRFGYSAILHDVGKMIVPDEVLKKPGPLTPEERRIIESHTLAGERILSNSPFFEIARLIARSHHENWDGTGYPDALANEAIPFAARIVRLADVYDALLSPRVYKPAWRPEDAVAVVRKGRGNLFDPAICDVFLRIQDTHAFQAIRELPA
ncbi:MAG: HD domain-containing protein [Phycisphaerae bacterium]|nr:HD domain-containing protein [Phycisphaerae bacterium]